MSKRSKNAKPSSRVNASEGVAGALGAVAGRVVALASAVGLFSGRSVVRESRNAQVAAYRPQLVRESRRLMAVSQEMKAGFGALKLKAKGSVLLPSGNTPEAVAACELFARWGSGQLAEHPGPDPRGLDSLAVLQGQHIEEGFVAGDWLGVFGTAGSVSVVEAERLGGPLQSGRAKSEHADKPEGHEIVEGVETDPGGRVVAAYVSPGYVAGGAMARPEAVRIGMEHAVLYGFREHPCQLRGEPLLARAADDLEQIDKVIASVGAVQQLAALLAFQTNTESPAGTQADLAAAANDDDSGAPGGGDPARRVIPDGNGRAAVLNLRPGESATALNPNQPNATLDRYADQVIRRLCGMLGLPREVLFRDYSRANFSVANLALLVSEETAAPIRNAYIDAIMRPMYRRFVAWARSRGLLERPAAPGPDPALDVVWRKPPMPIIDVARQLVPLIEAVKDGVLPLFVLHERLDVSLGEVVEDRARTLEAFESRGVRAPAWLTGDAEGSAERARDAADRADEQDRQEAAERGDAAA